MRRLNELTLENKTVLVRADFNVPLDDKLQITDDNRIQQFLPTLKFLLAKQCKVVLCSHMGQPANGPEAGLSLAPVAAKLSELLGQTVQMTKDCVGPEVEGAVRGLAPGSALLLENLRFHSGETKNDPEFAALLARLGEVYVNDAFGTAHRAHASVVGVAKLFKEKATGLLMQRELDYYRQALVTPTRPLTVVLGGAKVSSKLRLLVTLADKADRLIIGGAMANTFLAAQGLQLGKSLVERELFGKALEIIGSMGRRDAKFYLPVDFKVGTSIKNPAEHRAVPAIEFPASLMALDIGPATSLLYREALQDSGTIVWNGPMGAYENEDFAVGTSDMVESIASTTAVKIVGGGDTDAAIHKMELAHKFDFISTGGGAFLTLLEGQELPAVTALGV